MKLVTRKLKKIFEGKIPWTMFLVFVVVIGLRIPSLFEPYSYGDEGIYLVLGQGLRKGLVFYRDIHDNKPPLLYAVAGLAGSLEWFRAILLGWNLFNVWLVWKIGERIFKSERVGFFSAIIFAIASSLPTLEGNIANGEIFMIMPFCGAIWVLWEAIKRKKEGWFFWAGVLASVGFLFKIPILFDFAAIVFWLMIISFEGKKTGWKKMFLRVGKIIGGFLVLNVLFFGYYSLKGAGEPYLRSALMQNIGYLSSWGGQDQTGGLPIGLLMRAGVGGVLALGLVGFKKKLGNGIVLLGLWFIGGMFGALLSERPYPHYLMEIVAPLALLGGLVLGGDKKIRIISSGLLVGGVLLTIVVWKVYDFWEYKTVPYYQNFLSYVRGKKTKDEYNLYWGDHIDSNYRMAEEVKMRTNNKDRIFVWGTEPAVYYLSNRLPVGRYTVAYHIMDFDGYEETMEAIRGEKPKVMLRLKTEKGEFDEFYDYLYLNYRLEKEDENWELWERVSF